MFSVAMTGKPSLNHFSHAPSPLPARIALHPDEIAGAEVFDRSRRKRTIIAARRLRQF
jgi:hypothetical protein